MRQQSLWGLAASLAVVMVWASPAAAQYGGYPYGVQHAGGLQASAVGYQPVMPAVYFGSGNEFADPAAYYAASLGQHSPAASGGARGYHALADAGPGCHGCGDHCEEECDSCHGVCLFNPFLLLGCGWRVRGEGVLLHRAVGGNEIYSVNDATGGIGLANDNLDFDYEWSFRVAAEKRVHCDNSIEASYFGLFYWDDTAVALSPTESLQSLYADTGVPLAGFSDAFFQSLRYRTELHSAEINYWRPLKCHGLGSIQVSTAWGARWLKIDEELDIVSASTTAVGASETHTRNDLVGGHFGWLVSVPLNCNWQLRWGGRAGIFGNIGRQNTEVYTADATGVTSLVDESFRRGDAAFVGSMDAQLAYRLNCGWSVYVGTELLWVEGVALAAEQFQPEVGPGRIARLNDNGLAYYQGFHFGVEATW